MPEVNRRQFFTQLFGAVAPTVAVAVYPAATLGILERFFWKPLKTYFHFQPDPAEAYFLAMDALFKRVYAEKLQCAIPEVHFWIREIDPIKKEITIDSGVFCDHLEIAQKSAVINEFMKSPLPASPESVQDFRLGCFR